MAVTSTGTPTDQWRELNDDAFNAPFMSSDQFTKCRVNLHYEGTTVSHTSNLPVYPEDVTNQLSTTYNDYQIVGRTGNISTYNYTGDKVSSFTLHMHRELKTYGNELKDENHIDRIVALIEAAQYPYIDETANGTWAPIITYKFGDTVITGKQTACTTKWSGPKIEGKYMEVTMNITVSNVPKKILDYSDIINSNPRGYGIWEL